MSTKANCPFCGEPECFGVSHPNIRRLVQSARCKDREMDRITDRIERLEAEIKAMREKKEAKP